MLLAVADCERIHDGLIAQPVNTASSLAYLVSGAALVAQAGRVSGARRASLAVFGTVTASNALGGLGYHGTGGTVGRWLHDGALVATLALVGAGGVLVARRRARPPGLVAAGITGGLAIAVYVTSRTGGPLCQPDSLVQGHAVWHVLTAGLLWWWGRTSFLRT